MVVFKRLLKEVLENGRDMELETTLEIPKEVLIGLMKSLCIIAGLFVGKEIGNNLFDDV